MTENTTRGFVNMSHNGKKAIHGLCNVQKVNLNRCYEKGKDERVATRFSDLSQHTVRL